MHHLYQKNDDYQTRKTEALRSDHHIYDSDKKDYINKEDVYT